MTNYEFLDDVIQYMKKTYQMNLYITDLPSPFLSNKKSSRSSIYLQLKSGGVWYGIEFNDSPERFKKRVYEICNLCLEKFNHLI